MRGKEEMENKICFMFAGIGEDYRKKMDKLCDDEMSYIAKLSHKAEKEFGIKIMEYLLSNEDVQYDTLTIWSAIYTCDYVIGKTYRKVGIVPELLMGYSMGLITAIASGDGISYLDGIRILKAILKYHKGEYPESMATVIGFHAQELSKLIGEHAIQEVFPACINNEYCIVVSGLKESVEKTVEMVTEHGAIKVHPIATNFAFHTHYFEDGIEILEDCVKQIEIRDLEVPILSSITQKVLTDKEELRTELVQNMFSVMKWKDSVETACDMGCNIFYEASLGKGLVKCSRVINGDCGFYGHDRIRKQYF